MVSYFKENFAFITCTKYYFFCFVWHSPLLRLDTVAQSFICEQFVVLLSVIHGVSCIFDGPNFRARDDGCVRLRSRFVGFIK